MKAFSLIVLLAVLIPAIGQAQKLRTNTGTRIHWETVEYDFGRIPQHVPASTVFKYKANGLEPVVMQYVKPSCGCTMPEYDKAHSGREKPVK